MQLYAFWALRGYTPAQMSGWTRLEKAFFEASREIYYDEIYEALGGKK